MTADRERLLQTTQRKMLRKILGQRRRPSEPPDQEQSDLDSSTETAEEALSCSSTSASLEPWVDYIIRTTHTAVDVAQGSGVRSWVTLQRERKWAWAGHVARRTDARWSTSALDWQPVGVRKPGHPKRRWEDDLNNFDTDWKALAQQQEHWRELAQAFCSR